MPEFKNSSNLKGYEYTSPDGSEVGELIVQFSNSTRYTYKDVPRSLIKEWDEAESAGKFFASRIKGQYEFTKLPPPDEEEEAAA